MKKAFFIFVSLFIILNLFSIDVESQVKIIRKYYGEVNGNIKNNEKTMKYPEFYGAEGATLEIYRDKKTKEITKMVLNSYGEMQKILEEYYFYNGKLFFIFTQKDEYNAPMYLTREEAEKMGMTEYFDEKKSKIYQNRYYFHENKLIKWLGENKNIIDPKSSQFSQEEAKLLKDLADLENLANE